MKRVTDHTEIKEISYPWLYAKFAHHYKGKF